MKRNLTPPAQCGRANLELILSERPTIQVHLKPQADMVKFCAEQPGKKKKKKV